MYILCVNSTMDGILRWIFILYIERKLFLEKFFSENEKLLNWISVFVIVVPLFIIICIRLDCIDRDLGLSIIGYAGSIIGGFITLFGVWWTINSNEEIRKKDIILQYRPFLNYEIENYKKQYKRMGEIALSFENEYFSDISRYTDEHLLIVKNAGKGDIEKINFIVKKCDVITSPVSLGDANGQLSNSYFLGNQYIDFIPSDDEIYIAICIPTVKKDALVDIDFDNIFILSIELGIEYKGTMSTEIYNQTLKLNLSIEYDKNIKGYKTEIYNTSMIQN